MRWPRQETTTLLIAAQNNAIKTNHAIAKFDNTQWNSKCSSCGDRDEAVNYLISGYSKLTQKKYKSTHDWVGKVINWELCKRLIFDHADN